MPTMAAFADANDNAEMINIAAELAYDAIASYYDARDIPVPIGLDVCQDHALQIAFDGAKGWEYDARDKNDPCGEIALKIIERHGLNLRSGSIGFDATYQPIVK